MACRLFLAFFFCSIRSLFLPVRLLSFYHFTFYSSSFLIFGFSLSIAIWLSELAFRSWLLICLWLIVSQQSAIYYSPDTETRHRQCQFRPLARCSLSHSLIFTHLALGRQSASYSWSVFLKPEHHFYFCTNLLPFFLSLSSYCSESSVNREAVKTVSKNCSTSSLINNLR